MTRSIAPLGVLAVVLLAATGTFVFASGAQHVAQTPGSGPSPDPGVGGSSSGGLAAADVAPPTPDPANVTTFESAEAFSAYLRQSRLETRFSPRNGWP